MMCEFDDARAKQKTSIKLLGVIWGIFTLLQVTRLKIQHNPFAKGFRERECPAISPSCGSSFPFYPSLRLPSTLPPLSPYLFFSPQTLLQQFNGASEFIHCTKSKSTHSVHTLWHVF